MGFGTNITKERKKLRLSQVELASMLNVTRQTVSFWERNIYTPANKHLFAMRDIFGCTLDELITPDPARRPSCVSARAEMSAESAV